VSTDTAWMARSDSAGAGGTSTATPWLFVVARGHARLAAELRAIFEDWPWVQVIEDRRQDRGLLPRGTGVLRPTF
jgi:hypothetical protein